MRLFRYLNYFIGVLIVVFAILILRERYLVTQNASEISIEQTPSSDCGVVLTGYPGRLKEALEVLSKGKIKKLIVSGVYKNAQLKEIFPQLETFPKLNHEDIILEKISGSTYQNAVQSLQLVQVLKCHDVLLMTSNVHMYRALRTFKDIFPEDIEIKTYPIINPNKEYSEFETLYEALKSLFYSIMLPVLQLQS